MPNEPTPRHPDSVGAWVKQFHRVSQAAIDRVLRPYGLGPTQWYVLYHLANDGPTTQRDLAETLQVERATLSGIVASLVRKGLVEQSPDAADQRRRVLRLTPAGQDLWEALPDPIATVGAVAFDGIDPADLERAIRVLEAATRHLTEQSWEGTQP
ncbi:MarR family winged helix-turn-helix transcriptional regulator [Dactylosporangium sp. NPDC000555]|uniref:MarR family winged helix-turn-helix transcriptional regulator n=1 Tax=Dactylosporangium sp. NPDC000555 TaxID=3154260 RepID=UPI00332FF728